MALPSFLPIPVSIVAVLSAYAFYFLIEPRLDRGFPGLYDFPYKPFKRYTWRRFIDMASMVVMLTLVMILLTEPSLKWPTSWGNLTHDLFIARAMGDDSAHIFTYLVMPTLFFYVWHREKDSCKAFLYVLFMAFIHESTWIAFYYVRYWPYVVYWLLLPRDISFLIFVGGFGSLWLLKYKQFNSVLKLGLVGLVLLNLAWLSVGFPITNVSNIQYAPGLAVTATGQTAYFNTLWVNMIEVGYWWYALAIFAIAEWWATRTITISPNQWYCWRRVQE